MRVIFDLVDFLSEQRQWSLKTFGSKDRTEGILKHIESEVAEVRRALAEEGPERVLDELVDIVILAFDAGIRLSSIHEFLTRLESKANKNMHQRTWPDPDDLDPDQPSFHQ